MSEAQVSRLEKQLDEYNVSLPPLKEFILPGGTPAAAHMSRCARGMPPRGAMRGQAASIPSHNTVHIEYLNRLSDFLFVLCRILNHHNGVGGCDVAARKKPGFSCIGSRLQVPLSSVIPCAENYRSPST